MDNGIDAIDTAPIYGCGHSEEVVGKAIEGKRDRVKLLTKCGLRWDDVSGDYYFTLDSPDGGKVTCYKNVRAESILHECEQSLKRLGTDVIDLYQVHWPSDTATAEETMSALVRLREQGKIKQIGVSNYDAAELEEAGQHGTVVSDQIKYNLLEREIEADTLPYCRDRGIGVICYSPMARGLLTGKVTMERTFPATDIRRSGAWFQPVNRKRVLDALDRIRPIAEQHGVTLAQLVVAWVLAQPGVTTALVGARTADQAAENARAADCILTESEVAMIRETFEALEGPLEA
jgi:aryl-alcohol dehydrogenase-like predicted oxidoreductase